MGTDGGLVFGSVALEPKPGVTAHGFGVPQHYINDASIVATTRRRHRRGGAGGWRCTESAEWDPIGVPKGQEGEEQEQEIKFAYATAGGDHRQHPDKVVDGHFPIYAAAKPCPVGWFRSVRKERAGGAIDLDAC